MDDLVKWQPQSFERGLDKIIHTRLRLSQFVVEAEAKKVAPVDTGRLRSSIHSVDLAVGDRTAMVATGTNYAIYVELGTRKMEGRFFMRRGLDISRPRLMTIWR